MSKFLLMQRERRPNGRHRRLRMSTLADLASALNQNVENKTVLLHGTPRAWVCFRQCDDGLVEYDLSPIFPAKSLRMSLAKHLPNFSAERRTV